MVKYMNIIFYDMTFDTYISLLNRPKSLPNVNLMMFNGTFMASLYTFWDSVL